MASLTFFCTKRLTTRTVSSSSLAYSFSLFASHSSINQRPSTTASLDPPTGLQHSPLQNHPSFPLPTPRNLTNSFFRIRPPSPNRSKFICTTIPIGIRRLSTSPGEPKAPGPPQAGAAPSIESFKHQEIEGPTVERDLSPLANETRDVLDRLRKNVYNLSNSVAVLGIAQILCSAWIAWLTKGGGGLPEASVQGLAAIAFPFAMAVLLRQAVKPMGFFRKMEEMGRLQILTLSLQVAKSVDQLVRRTQLISTVCGAGVLIGLLIAAWSR